MPLTSSTLLATAHAITAELKPECDGSSVRIRVPRQATASETNGWRASIGSLSNGAIKLEIWLDRFSGHPERKFYAGFGSTENRRIRQLVKRAKHLMPVRTVTSDDTLDGRYVSLANPLRRAEFNEPILEQHDYWSYFGVYDPTRGEFDRVHQRFVARAAAFFVDVVRTLPDFVAGGEETTIYQAVENRMTVASHLRRERNRYLAEDCKDRDAYICKVCGFDFEDFYGPIGRCFAEAHHCVPLSQLSGSVRTSVDDLITVCANCHRMLHRMTGEAEDLQKLKKAIKSQRLAR